MEYLSRGSDYDTGDAVAVDGSGNVYVAGSSNATWEWPARAYTGSWDAFVAKMDDRPLLYLPLLMR